MKLHEINHSYMIVCTAIFAVHILDNFFPTLMLKININVRRLIPCFTHKTSKKEIDLTWVNCGDTKDITHSRVCGSSSSLTDSMA